MSEQATVAETDETTVQDATVSTEETAAPFKAEELKEGAGIWVLKAADKLSGRQPSAAIFKKLSPDGARFQAKVGGAFPWLMITELVGPRELAKIGASASTGSATKPTNGTTEKAAKAKKEPKAKEAKVKEPKEEKAVLTDAEKQAAKEKREARKAEKKEKRDAAKAERDAEKLAKKEAREKAAAEKGEGTGPKSRGKGIRLAANVLGFLKDEIPAVSVSERDQFQTLDELSEKLGKRKVDMEKAIDVLVQEGHATKELVEVAADGEAEAYSYVAVKLTPEGRSYEKKSASRGKASGEKPEPMQKRIADLVRQHYTNEEIMEALSTPPNEETGDPGYTLARSFVSTVRSRVKDPELYDFKYATAADQDRDYLKERKQMDKDGVPAGPKAQAQASDEVPAEVEGSTSEEAAAPEAPILDDATENLTSQGDQLETEPDEASDAAIAAGGDTVEE